jgi:hypothetical protein
MPALPIGAGIGTEMDAAFDPEDFGPTCSISLVGI